jgi:membrane-associated phospholipid phosphatase
MEKYRRIFIINRSFFTGVFIFLCTAGCYLLFASRAGSFLILNPYHSYWLDQFFIYFTNLGDGIFSILIFFILIICKKVDWAIQVLAAFLLSALISQVLKNFIYSPRPKDFFGLTTQHIYILKDITLGGGASFPSGHSTSAFALATSMALFSKNKENAWWYLIPAILVGYSRIYLSQHFPKDVFAGAVIGVVSAVLVYGPLQSFRRDRLKNEKKRGGKIDTSDTQKNSLSFNSLVLISTHDL